MVRCHDDSIYTGIATDVKKRMQQHLSGKGAKYTRSHKVKELLALWQTQTMKEAAKLECRIKRLTRAKKLMLIENKEDIKVYFPNLCEIEVDTLETFSLENLP